MNSETKAHTNRNNLVDFVEFDWDDLGFRGA